MIRELKRQGLSKKDIMEYLEYENKELYHLMETERFYSNKHISRLEQENTKLEKENKKLKSKISCLELEKADFSEGIDAYLSMLDERDNRIQKAIEYIEENCENYAGLEEYKVKDLLDILKGSDK